MRKENMDNIKDFQDEKAKKDEEANVMKKFETLRTPESIVKRTQENEHYGKRQEERSNRVVEQQDEILAVLKEILDEIRTSK